jgi:hypothetical protein
MAILLKMPVNPAERVSPARYVGRKRSFCSFTRVAVDRSFGVVAPGRMMEMGDVFAVAMSSPWLT